VSLRQQLDALYQQSLNLRSQGLLPEADRLEAEAADLLKSLKRQVEEHPQAPETADALLFLAEREWALHGDDLSIQAMIEEAIHIRESVVGSKGSEMAEALRVLAEFHFLAGRWGEAEPLYRRAIGFSEKDARSPIFAKTFAGLAQSLAHLGRLSEADPYFEKAIGLCGRSEDEKRVLYFLLIYRAEGLDKMGRGSEAEALRASAQKLLPRNNPGEQGFHV